MEGLRDAVLNLVMAALTSGWSAVGLRESIERISKGLEEVRTLTCRPDLSSQRAPVEGDPQGPFATAAAHTSQMQ
jgi:hypothetical protein